MMQFAIISTFLAFVHFNTGSNAAQPTNSPTDISVTVQLTFADYTNEDVIPALNLTAAEGTTAFQFLKLAAQQNPCYLFQSITYPTLGNYITNICCVGQNTTTNFYWFIYINNTLSPVGVDLIEPNNGDVLEFKYRFINSTSGNHTEINPAPDKLSLDEGTQAGMISVYIKLVFSNFPNPNVIPPQQVIAPNGTAAFEFLQLAAQVNPCYAFQHQSFQIGRYITTICCVEQNTTNNFYWFVYINEKLSPVGVDLLKPKNGDTLRFDYQLSNFNSNHTTPNPTMPNGKGHNSAMNLKVYISLVIVFLASNTNEIY